jgi:hypothetical protein
MSMVRVTAGMVHVTNRVTPPGSDDDASRAYGRRHQLTTASMVYVTKLTPGSERPPTLRCVRRCSSPTT